MKNHENEFQRIRQAYHAMAMKAEFRPAASQLEDCECKGVLLRIDAEAKQYAYDFITEENGLDFHIGISNWQTNRVLVYLIEACRQLCKVQDDLAEKLIQMPLEELRSAKSARMEP